MNLPEYQTAVQEAVDRFDRVVGEARDELAKALSIARSSFLDDSPSTGART